MNHAGMTPTEMIAAIRVALDAGLVQYNSSRDIKVITPDPFFSDETLDIALNQAARSVWAQVGTWNSDWQAIQETISYTGSVESIRIESPNSMLSRRIMRLVLVEDVQSMPALPIPRVHYASRHRVYALSYCMQGGNLYLVPYPPTQRNLRISYIPQLEPIDIRSMDPVTEPAAPFHDWVVQTAACIALERERSTVPSMLQHRDMLMGQAKELVSSRISGPHFGRFTRFDILSQPD
jgi:hypothetical protein